MSFTLPENSLEPASPTGWPVQVRASWYKLDGVPVAARLPGPQRQQTPPRMESRGPGGTPLLCPWVLSPDIPCSPSSGLGQAPGTWRGPVRDPHTSGKALESQLVPRRVSLAQGASPGRRPDQPHLSSRRSGSVSSQTPGPPGVRPRPTGAGSAPACGHSTRLALPAPPAALPPLPAWSYTWPSFPAAPEPCQHQHQGHNTCSCQDLGGSAPRGGISLPANSQTPTPPWQLPQGSSSYSLVVAAPGARLLRWEFVSYFPGEGLSGLGTCQQVGAGPTRISGRGCPSGGQKGPGLGRKVGQGLRPLRPGSASPGDSMSVVGRKGPAQVTVLGL